MNEHFQYVVGIDLGTTNTLACYFKNGRKTLVNFDGKSLLPSAVYVAADGKVIVGQKALNKGAIDRQNLITSSKRYIGDYETNMVWELRGRKFTPTDVATEILKTVKKKLVSALKCDENEKIGAVITVPAYFNNNQRNETRKAGEAAGFSLIGLLEEPVSAALEAARSNTSDKKVFVIDIGGGTFDLTVLEADEKNHIYRTVALDGDPRLGGDDFDAALQDHLVKIIQDDTGRDLSDAKISGFDEATYHNRIHNIITEAQKAKIELSTSEETNISIYDFFDDYDFDITLSRTDFNEICNGIFDKIFTRTKNFVNSGKFKSNDVGKIILVGGTCYIPHIEEVVADMFKTTPEAGLEKSMLVAYGAATYARWRNGGVQDNEIKDDEIIYDIKNIIPHSLGIETFENNQYLFTKILKKSTAYPCEGFEMFTTTIDNQTEVDINVYEAGNDDEDKPAIQYHKFYGSLRLDKIPPAKRGVPSIKVSFAYDENQNLTVTALDMNTGHKEIKTLKSGVKAPSPKAAPIELMLLLDNSGSMSASAVSEAKNASIRLIEKMIDLTVHKMGVLYFNSYAQVLSGLTQDKGRLKSAVYNISTSYGSTDMIDALRRAVQEFSGNNERYILMMTDGYPDDKYETLNYAQKLRSSGIHLYTIGVGGIDWSYLVNMAGKDNALVIDTMSKLEGAFETIIGKITLRNRS